MRYGKVTGLSLLKHAAGTTLVGPLKCNCNDINKLTWKSSLTALCKIVLKLLHSLIINIIIHIDHTTVFGIVRLASISSPLLKLISELCLIAKDT